MACNPANLTPVTNIDGQGWLPVIWDYSTSDNVSVVDVWGYFGPGYRHLRQGDIVRVTANDGKALYYINGVTVSSQSVGQTKFAVASSFV